MILNKVHAGGLAFLSHAAWPDAALRLADMSFVQENHAQTALSNSASYTQGQAALEQAFVEIELAAVFLTLQLELCLQGFLVHTDTHTAQLNGALQDGIPDEQVAVQSGKAFLIRSGPVIIVGCAKVVWLSVTQLVSYAYDEYGSVFAADAVFAFFG